MGHPYCTVYSKGNVIFHGSWGDWRRAKGHLIAQYPALRIVGTPNKPTPEPTPEIALAAIERTREEMAEHELRQDFLKRRDMTYEVEPFEQSLILRQDTRMLAPGDRLDYEKIANGEWRKISPQRVWQAVQEWRSEGKSISPHIIRSAWECAEANKPAQDVFTMQFLERIYNQRTFKGADQTGA
jgi:hypothetical protein